MGIGALLLREIIYDDPHIFGTGQVDQTAESLDDSLVYENTQYGFRFTLPDSWKGYTIVTDKCEGLSSEDSQGENVVESGPKISIRNPAWTSEQPTQDISLLVFTAAQWNELQQGKFHIGAASIGPSELIRNANYVFALPARYNFAFPAGYQEVQVILNSKPIQPNFIIKIFFFVRIIRVFFFYDHLCLQKIWQFPR